MNRIRQRRQDRGAAEELDVTSFMNLMIVLVPVLLLSMTLTHTRVIDLDLPWGATAETLPDTASVRFEIVVDDSGFVVRDGSGAVVQAIPRESGAYDYRTLSLAMQALKREVPAKRDIALLLAADVDYQTLVSVMDNVRSYVMEADGTPIAVELFPVISLGDAPATPREDLARMGEDERVRVGPDVRARTGAEERTRAGASNGDRT